ncbi:MAG: hypothetical protein HN909_03175 [Phycisphaerales bacterium]|nr:hypothetical protein [Phycisphaerales bacterium]MBT7170753.1 hypothetical protein [Phycisphaerales bacterium]
MRFYLRQAAQPTQPTKPLKIRKMDFFCTYIKNRQLNEPPAVFHSYFAGSYTFDFFLRLSIAMPATPPTARIQATPFQKLAGHAQGFHKKVSQKQKFGEKRYK